MLRASQRPACCLDENFFRLMGLLPALQREHVELAVAELTRVGHYALHVLARAGGGRAAIVELRQFQLLGEHGTEAGVVGPAGAPGVDLVGAGRQSLC